MMNWVSRTPERGGVQLIVRAREGERAASLNLVPEVPGSRLGVLPMWFLFLLTLLNSALDEKGFVLVHRLEIGGMPINVLDGLLGLGGLFAAIGFMRSSPSRFQALRAHPVYVATIVLFVLAEAAGMIGAMAVGSKTYFVALFLRNMTAIPATMFCGYYFYKRPTSAKWFSYIHVMGGVCCAT